MDYKTPEELLYAPTHEWVRTEGDEVTVGITDYAQSALGDVVYVELPKVGTALTKGQPFGVIESVKAASDVYAPIGGEVIAVNDAVVSAPEMVNSSMYDQAWLMKLRPTDLAADRADLMDAAAYAKHAADEESKH